MEKFFYEARPYIFLAIAFWAMYECITGDIPNGKFFAGLLGLASGAVIFVRYKSRNKK